jgi:hypothetical protein
MKKEVETRMTRLESNNEKEGKTFKEKESYSLASQGSGYSL